MDASDYAKIVQENNMVPIVEPEVLMDGSHSIESCEDATKRCLSTLFESLVEKGVLEGKPFKPNMVVSGNECWSKESNKLLK